jgi:hypothetical protein
MKVLILGGTGGWAGTHWAQVLARLGVAIGSVSALTIARFGTSNPPTPKLEPVVGECRVGIRPMWNLTSLIT